MRKINLLLFLALITCAPVIASDVFNKIDDDTVRITTTSVSSASIRTLLKQRETVVLRLAEIDRQYKNERSALQGQIDIIDKQLKGSIDVGINIGIDPRDLKNQTVFSAAGSLTGGSDVP